METGPSPRLSFSSSAACSVCQASVAHLTRTGNSRTPAKAATVIAIRGDHFQRQILAVDRAGKGRDYGAILSAEYEVLHGGKPLQPKRSVQRRRDYLVSQAEGDPLTDEQRALEITDALRRDVAREILRQLTIQANAS